MGFRQFSFWIKEVNRLIEYMPGSGKKLSEDKKLFEILWFPMPSWYMAMAAQTRFDYSHESFQSISSYFSCLQVIKSMVNMAKGLSVGKKPTASMTKTGLTKKLETTKVTYGFCHKNRHIKDVG